MANKKNNPPPPRAPKPDPLPPAAEPRQLLLENLRLRICDLVRSMFPRGTELELHRPSSANPLNVMIRTQRQNAKVHWQRREAWERAPALPADVFAIAAMLLDLSGACHHVVRALPGDYKKAPSKWSRNLLVDDAMIEAASAVGKAWRARRPHDNKLSPPDEVQAHWNVLLRFWKHAVFAKMKPTRKCPEWWPSVLFLLMASDQAAAGVGFPRRKADGTPKPLDERDYLDLIYGMLLLTPPEDPKAKVDDPLLPAIGKAAHTISNVPPSIANVLPKARTPPLGCTLRSLTHHLSLLPPEGRARAAWHLPIDTFNLREATAPMNVLLVPFPFIVPSSSFIADSHRAADHDWNWFSLDHRKLPGTDEGRSEKFVQEFLEPLAVSAGMISGSLHGLVLPEASIGFATFKYLCRRIARAEPTSPWASIDFVVSGLRDDERGHHGNVAATAVFASGGDGTRDFLINTQQKHHRWRLESNQIQAYGLGSALSAHEPWWEAIELLSRSLNLYVFRRGAVLAPLICEDLARVDPVHDLIRALGPNLVIALLMDGGQVPSRWTGRSAMGLADDPGSSVLTLTSYGLIERANQRFVPAMQTHSIGLWRDQRGMTHELPLHPGASGVLLSLSGERVMERTLEGRSDNRKAIRFTLADQTCVYLDPTKDWYARGWSSPPKHPRT